MIYGKHNGSSVDARMDRLAGQNLFVPKQGLGLALWVLRKATRPIHRCRHLAALKLQVSRRFQFVPSSLASTLASTLAADLYTDKTDCSLTAGNMIWLEGMIALGPRISN